MVRLVLMMVMMLSVHMVLTGAGHDAVAGTGTGVHSRAATTRAGRVTVVQELEPVRHVKVFHRDVLLHFGRAEVRGAEGGQVAQGLALLLQRHDAVFLKHFEEKERKKEKMFSLVKRFFLIFLSLNWHFFCHSEVSRRHRHK